ncbi:hypothetical protein RRG08_016978 [Elysia crispata]|uniref:Uncharacterized protein n=1 Tax=Elysia crispata TaxID=231223 RepID=A0AAE0XZM0_9GAST|nr:hypothetical protein RRG08_016978 [Elysia crispata]
MHESFISLVISCGPQRTRVTSQAVSSFNSCTLHLHMFEFLSNNVTVLGKNKTKPNRVAPHLPHSSTFPYLCGGVLRPSAA